MFRSETARLLAERYAALVAHERDLAELEQRIRARHPETLTASQYTIMRRDFLRSIADARKLILAIAEAIYDDRDPQGDYRD